MIVTFNKYRKGIAGFLFILFYLEWYMPVYANNRRIEVWHYEYTDTIAGSNTFHAKNYPAPSFSGIANKSNPVNNHVLATGKKGDGQKYNYL